MKDSNFPFSGQELLACATKAVRGYALKNFSSLFSNDDLDDLTQDVVYKVLAAADSLDPARPLFPWVWTVAKHEVLSNVVRKQRELGRRVSLDAPGVIAAYDSRHAELPADAQLLADELAETLYGKLRTEREQLLFCWLHDELSDKEIAERLGVSDQTVYSAVFHLRGKLRSAV